MSSRDTSARLTSAPAILIRHAGKRYRRGPGTPHEAVKDVSLSVSTGAIHGLLGPNGAGKTTTLKMLLGLVKPSAGEFEILGVDARTPKARAAVGFLPEQPYFPPNLRALEALRFYADLSGAERNVFAEHAADLLARVGLAGT